LPEAQVALGNRLDLIRIHYPPIYFLFPYSQGLEAAPKAFSLTFEFDFRSPFHSFWHSYLAKASLCLLSLKGFTGPLAGYRYLRYPLTS